MTVAKDLVYLYAATKNDYVKALAAANVVGLPYSQCLGSYAQAWTKAADANHLVIAVGGAALYSLYYNPCDWSNPANRAGGSTPFTVEPSGQGIAKATANTFVNAAGFNAIDSLTLAVMLTYYAVHGTYPHDYGALPRQETPQKVCVKGSAANVSVGSITAPSSPVTTRVTKPSVGVYASFSSQTEVETALADGWSGIGVTAALGTPEAPYTSVVSGSPDVVVAKALEAKQSNAWWLSFWTVSWPSIGSTYHQAGFDGGVYAATQVKSYPGTRRPNYVILDPEGYNTPASTAQEFADFINGFAAGVTSVDANLAAGFYVNQSQYVNFQLHTISLPAFIAIAPISGNKPTVSGNNIEGYIAYYAGCPAASYVSQVETWGALYNTVQFPDSGIDCAPA